MVNAKRQQTPPLTQALWAALLLIGVGTALAGPLTQTAQASTRGRTPLHTRLNAGQPGGDIPDSAVYLRYSGRGFAIEYVEGWLQTTVTRGVIFGDKDSAVAVELRPPLRGNLTAYVQGTDMPRLAHAPGFRKEGLTHDSIGSYRALHLTYRGQSTPDAVTGKAVSVQIDRYYVQGPRTLAVLTLSTPLGVDNVDGFRRIAHSFRFRS